MTDPDLIVQYDDAWRRVTCGERSVTLSGQMAQIWRRLAIRHGSAVSLAEIGDLIDPLGELSSAESQVRVQICKLNKGLGKAGIPVTVKSLWGVGYYLPVNVQFVPESDAMTIGPDQFRLIKRLIAACRDATLAEQATQEFIDR